jgi:regulator of sigma E protease
MNPAEELPPEHAHRAYYRQPVWKRIVVIFAGPFVNIVLAFVILFGVFWSNGILEATATVDRVKPDSPAASVLVAGDTIVAVDGRRGDFTTLREQIGTHQCASRPPKDGCASATPARMTVEREGRLQTFSLRPVYDAGEGQTIVGFTPRSRSIAIGPATSAEYSLESMWNVTAATARVISHLFEKEQREQLSGFIGSYERTRQSVSISTTRTLLMLALISLSLALVNLLPFLPLDGGHIFWAVAEKVSGRPISFLVMERASVVGIALVGILFFIGLQNDIGRLTGEGFGPP